MQNDLSLKIECTEVHISKTKEFVVEPKRCVVQMNDLRDGPQKMMNSTQLTGLRTEAGRNFSLGVVLRNVALIKRLRNASLLVRITVTCSITRCQFKVAGRRTQKIAFVRIKGAKYAMR